MNRPKIQSIAIAAFIFTMCAATNTTFAIAIDLECLDGSCTLKTTICAGIYACSCADIDGDGTCQRCHETSQKCHERIDRDKERIDRDNKEFDQREIDPLSFRFKPTKTCLGPPPRTQNSSPLQPLILVKMKQAAGQVLLLSAGKADQFAGPLPGDDRPAFSYLMVRALSGDVDGEMPRMDPSAGCPLGQTRSQDTGGQCCWPGQSFSKSKDQCVGQPDRCPHHLVRLANTCGPFEEIF